MGGENNSLTEIWEKLKTCKSVAMTLHSGPDGDSLGSCVAMKRVLERNFGTEVTLVSGDPLPRDFSHLEFSREAVIKDISELDLSEFDVLIALDTGTMDMLGSRKHNYSLPDDLFVVNIDHHHTNNRYGTLNFIDATQPSTCSILVDAFQKLGVTFDKSISVPLLLGICTDTGFFNHGRNDMSSVFDQVSFLLHHGADYIGDIVKPYVNNRSLDFKKYLARVVLNAQISDDSLFAYSSVSKEEIEALGIGLSEARMGISQLQDLADVQFVFTLTEQEDCIKGSFRSARGVDVSKFAQALGGGGHKPAAAFALRGVSLAEAEKKVLDVIRSVGIHAA